MLEFSNITFNNTNDETYNEFNINYDILII